PSGPTPDRDEHVLEVLALPSPRAPVHVAGRPLLEAKPGVGEDALVEAPAVVDDDDDPPARDERVPGTGQDLRDALAVAGDAAPDLLLVSPLEAQKLERVDVLLVVVDQARVRR